MGGKRNGARQYLRLFIAAIILASLVNCAALKEMETKREACEYLATAQKLLAQGDYEGSLRENRKALSLSHNVPPGDKALFNMGLIHAHYGYHKRNYQESLDHFKRLVDGFPQSPLAAWAKIGMGLLQENERLHREIEDLNKIIKKSKQVDIEIDEKKRSFQDDPPAFQEDTSGR